MGARAYCHKCGHGIHEKPTIQDIMQGFITCSCGSDESLDKNYELTQYLQDLETRIEQLEKHSHEPFDFTHLIERLERLESK